MLLSITASQDWMNGPEAFPLLGIQQGFQSEYTEALELRCEILCLRIACPSINQLRFKSKNLFFSMSINLDFYKLLLKSG